MKLRLARKILKDRCDTEWSEERLHPITSSHRRAATRLLRKCYLLGLLGAKGECTMRLNIDRNLATAILGTEAARLERLGRIAGGEE